MTIPSTRYSPTLGGLVALAIVLLTAGSSARAEEPSTSEDRSAQQTAGSESNESEGPPADPALGTEPSDDADRPNRTADGRRPEGGESARAPESGQAEEADESAVPPEASDRPEDDPLERDFRPEGDPRSSRRSPPETDGLPDAKPTVGEVLLWIPRTVFFPVYLATNYLVRWPLGKLFTAIERHHVIERLRGTLTFDDGRAGFLPLVNIGGDRASSFGVRFFYDDLANETLDIDAGFEGMPRRNWLGQLKLDLRVPDEWSELKLRAGAKKRDDYMFYGVGPQSNTDRRDARYTKRTFLGRLGWLIGGGDASQGRGRLHVEAVDRKISCSPSLANDVCTDGIFGNGNDRYPIGGNDEDRKDRQIAGLKQDYTFLSGGLGYYVDTRPPHPGSGVRLQSAASIGRAVGTPKLQALRLETEWAGYLELPGTYRRVLGFRLRAESAAPHDGGKIPVDELVELGGVEKMRGFRSGRFRGRSLLMATLNYRYPIWSFLDGQVFAEVGELSGLYWNDFHPGLLRASAGLALRTRNIASRQNSYTLNVAVGSSRFHDAFSIEEVRVNFGTNWGF